MCLTPPCFSRHPHLKAPYSLGGQTTATAIRCLLFHIPQSPLTGGLNPICLLIRLYRLATNESRAKVTRLFKTQFSAETICESSSKLIVALSTDSAHQGTGILATNNICNSSDLKPCPTTHHINRLLYSRLRHVSTKLRRASAGHGIWHSWYPGCRHGCYSCGVRV